MVKVYFNLHKKKFSVQSKVNGRWKVVKHVDEICLQNVRFKVSEAGRQRVLREKRKNVHAYVIGEEIPFVPKSYCWQDTVVYNPYKYETFVVANQYYHPVDEMKYVTLKDKKIIGILPKLNGYAF